MEVNTALSSRIAGLDVKLLRDEHLPALQELCLACADFTRLTRGQEPAPQEAWELVNECPPGKTPADKEIYAIFEEGTMVGVIELLRDYPKQDDWFLGLMMFAPEWRGKGLGNAAVLWLESLLKARSVNNLGVAVLEVNPRGRRFWQRMGFQEVRAVENYPSGSLTTTAYVMNKAIKQTTRH